MEIKAKDIKLVDINLLVENPKNNNTHPEEQIERLAKLINHTGFRNPLVVSNRSGFVLCGHGRIAAAKKAGLKELPVIYQDFKDEAEEYQYMTADNAIHNWSVLDLAKINLDIQELGPFDIDLLGIKDFVVEPLEKFEPQADEDEVPEVVQPITRRGDIWLLGNHRLMCGDSTMINDVEKLMNGEKADMVFTDPPYGVDYHGCHVGLYRKGDNSDRSVERIKNDKELDISEIYNGFLGCMVTVLNGPAYIFCGAGKEREVLNSIYESGLKIINTLIWRKDNGSTALNANYKPVYEIFYYTQVGKDRRWIGDHSQWTCWDIKRNAKNEYHPTQKPIDLIERALLNHSAKSVLDFFLGSGSTLIACEKTNRKCFGMELDEKYCDVIIQRWEKYSGKKAFLELTNQTYEELKAERIP